MIAKLDIHPRLPSAYEVVGILALGGASYAAISVTGHSVTDGSLTGGDAADVFVAYGPGRTVVFYVTCVTP
jgi:hypothetical protein